jgi:hypothetical protein
VGICPRASDGPVERLLVRYSAECSSDHMYTQPGWHGIADLLGDVPALPQKVSV